MPNVAAPADQNFATKRGASLLFEFTFTEDPGNIAGRTYAFGAKATRDETATYLIEKTPMTIVNASPGTSLVALSCTLTSAEHKAVADLTDGRPKRVYWDVWRTDAGQEKCVGTGVWTIEATPRHG